MNNAGLWAKSTSIVAQYLSFLDGVQGNNTLNEEIKDFEENLDII